MNYDCDMFEDRECEGLDSQQDVNSEEFYLITVTSRCFLDDRLGKINTLAINQNPASWFFSKIEERIKEEDFGKKFFWDILCVIPITKDQFESAPELK